MKKSILFIVLISVLFLFSGCRDSTRDIIERNLSDIRYDVYDGENDRYYVSLTSGMREESYEYDGRSEELVEFGIIAVYPKNKSEEKVMNVMLINKEVIEELTLEKSPYEDGYMADIGRIIESATELKISFGTGEEIGLESRSDKWGINYAKALEIGIKEYGETIEKYIDKKELAGECYLKIIYDKNREIKTYYWYFAFLTSDGKNYTCVIDTETGEVLAKI